MAEERNGGIVAVDGDVLHGCHQILSAVNILVVNLEFASERVDGETKAAIDDARAGLETIIEVTRAIYRLHERKVGATDPPLAAADPSLLGMEEAGGRRAGPGVLRATATGNDTAEATTFRR